MNLNQGGPAFPGGVNAVFSDMEQGEPTQPGMSLLDYMAARAMNAYILSLPPDATLNPTVIANWSYKMAGAMLATRAAL